MDHLNYMLFSSADFHDEDLIGRDLEAAFCELNGSFELLRKKLGEERYAKLVELSGRMRAHFEADPKNETDDTIRG